MRGFTLIELLVVLLIMAGAFAIGVPLISGRSAVASAERDVRALVSTLREARSQAILKNRETVVDVAADTGGYGIRGTSIGGRIGGGATLSLVVAAIERSGEAVGGVRFFPDGSSTGGEINISEDGRTYVVEVEWLTGRVAVAR